MKSGVDAIGEAKKWWGRLKVCGKVDINDADVAQLGEHETEDLRVAGSIPAISTFLISFNFGLQMRYSTFLKK